jgi:hypothetical protein
VHDRGRRRHAHLRRDLDGRGGDETAGAAIFGADVFGADVPRTIDVFGPDNLAAAAQTVDHPLEFVRTSETRVLLRSSSSDRSFGSTDE